MLSYGVKPYIAVILIEKIGLVTHFKYDNTISYHIISYHIRSDQIISYHVISYHNMK